MGDAPTSAGLGTLFMLLAMIAASVWLGTVAQRVVERGSFMKSYFLGNRGLGSWALALTATVQSGGTFMGFPSLVYSNGWIVALWISSYMVVPLTGFAVIAKRFAQLSRRTGAITVPDLLRERFGDPRVGLVASLLILFLMTVMMVAQFKAGALIMKLSLPGSNALALSEDGTVGFDSYYYFGLAVFTLTVVGYTLIGGFLAAVWTDLFQSVLMWIGIMLLLPLTIVAAGGLPAAGERMRYEMVAKTTTKEESEEQSQRLAAVMDRLRSLDKALRDDAARSGGWLPERLDDLDAVSNAAAQDGLLKRHGTQYFGAGKQIDAAGAAQRVPLVVTAANDKGWRAVLYSNGVVRAGKFSEPGALASGPGPFNFLLFGMAISFFFQWAFAGMGSPASMVRVMACRDTTTVRRSIVLLGTYNMCIYIPLILICVCAHSVMPDLPLKNSDETIPRLALLTTSGFFGGSFVSGLILAAPFGAVMATVSSYLVVIASGLVRDVYQRFINPEATQHELKRLAYFVMIIVGAIGLAANIQPIDYLQKLVVFSGTCGAVTFVAPAIMAAYWRRATAAGVIAAMVTGVGVSIAMYAAGLVINREFKPYSLLGFDPIVWGMGLSMLAGLLVSLCTTPPSAELVSKLFDVQPKPLADSDSQGLVPQPR
jgi:Na+/proline symporter